MARGREAARKLVALRKKVAGECMVCGEKFHGYVGKLTCSDRCRKAASRMRKRLGGVPGRLALPEPPPAAKSGNRRPKTRNQARELAKAKGAKAQKRRPAKRKSKPRGV